MEIHKLVERVQNSSDLELAILLCLIAKQHCRIEVEDELVDDLALIAVKCYKTDQLSVIIVSLPSTYRASIWCPGNEIVFELEIWIEH